MHSFTIDVWFKVYYDGDWGNGGWGGNLFERPGGAHSYFRARMLNGDDLGWRLNAFEIVRDTTYDPDR